MVSRSGWHFVVFALVVAPVAQAATTVTAIHAKQADSDGARYDTGSREFRELLEPLEYDDFTVVVQKDVDLAADREVRVKINARYTVSFSETEYESDGHVKSTVRVFGLPRNANEPVEVLEMSVRLAPEKPVMIRGLRMEEGEIVVFLEAN